MTNSVWNDLQFEVNGKRLCEVSVNCATWDSMRADILKMESESFPDSLADSEDTLHSLATSPTAIFLAFTSANSEKTIGYIAGDLMENFSDIPGILTDPNFGKRNSIYFLTDAIIPEYRGHGLGEMLVRRGLKAALQRGIKRATGHIDHTTVNNFGVTNHILESFTNWYGTGRSFYYIEIDAEV